MISTQRRVLTIIVHPNFWIGTLRDSENSEFCPVIWLKRHNFCGRWKDLSICCKVWKTCCLRLSVSFFPLQPFILKHSDTSPSCENLIKWNNKIQFIFTLLAFDHPPNLWLQSASKLFRFSPRLSPNTDIVGTSSTPKWASKPSNNNTRSCIFRLLSFDHPVYYLLPAIALICFRPPFSFPPKDEINYFNQWSENHCSSFA